MAIANNDLRPARLERIREALRRRGLAGAVLTRPEYGSHLTGEVGGPLVVGESRVFRLDGVSTPSWAETLDNGEPARWRTAVRAAGLAGRPVGVETRFLTLESARALADCGDLLDVEDDLARARLAKDVQELSVIATRVRTLENAFRAVARSTRPGLTEIDVALAAETAISRAAGRLIPFRGNLGAGRMCVDPDCQPTTRVLADGDAFLLDLYPDFGGYAADLTRCLIVGPASESVSGVHRVLEEALAAALTAVRAGTPAYAVDAAVRRVFADAGVLAYFPHHAGHGLGLFAREAPTLEPGDETILPPGAVLAIEPGLYLPGRGAFRLEVNVAVTEAGCTVLGDLPPHLLVCGPMA